MGRGGRRTEDGADHLGEFREPPLVDVLRRFLPTPATQLELESQQLAQEVRTSRPLELGQVVLDARPPAGPPGLLEAITDVIDAAVCG
jgi:hypothetical protein